MDPSLLTMFVPLAKADAAQRLVYGSFDETPDRSGEVFDYATSKPLIEAWSGEIAKASDGKSFGNVRAQHGRNAAGKLVDITFDDLGKSVGFVAKIVDDDEWKKVEEGVYTGFSPGGKYAKRWQDGGVKRYTADVRELSIVDVPCNPAATFTMVKADGTEEEREFVLAKAYEPGNDATKARADDLAKAAGGTAKAKDYVAQARAELIAENAAAELAKMAEAVDEPVERVASQDELDAALAKADDALGKANKAKMAGVKFADPDDKKYPVDTAAHIRAAWSYINMPKNQKGMDDAKVKSIKDNIIAAWKAKIDKAGPPSAEKMAAVGGDLQKSLVALDRLRGLVDEQAAFAKSLSTVRDVAQQLRDFSWIAQSVCWEERAEGDVDSQLPQQSVNLLMAMRTFLVEMVTEETAELLASMQNSTGDVIALVLPEPADEPDTVVLELASQIVDLVKADEDLMAKAGARNNKADAAKIQSMHDNAVALGATCQADAVKADALTAENERLAKAVDATLPRLEKLAEAVGTLTAAHEADQAAMTKMATEIADLKKQPAAPKGSIHAVTKEADSALTKTDDGANEDGNISLIERARRARANL